MLRNQGKDTTLEPAYFSKRSLNNSSQEVLDEIIRELEELNLIVKGSASGGYEDGLVSRVEVLEQQIKDIQIYSQYHIYYDTTENWNNQPTLIGERGSIYIYSDGKSMIDEETGQTVFIPRLKVGDGSAYLIDNPFIDSDIREKVDTLATITQEDIDRWDEKVSAKINSADQENLVLFF